MNKSFKVVFSKARGALMVVNELTSSVQAKGTKTVIAAAVAGIVAGGAVAKEVSFTATTDSPFYSEAKESASALKWVSGDVLMGEFATTPTSGQFGLLKAGADGASYMNEGQIVLNGKNRNNHFAMFATAGKIVNAKNGVIKVSQKGSGMVAMPGFVEGDIEMLNQGTIQVDDNGYGMAVLSSSSAAAGKTKSVSVINEGTISVDTTTTTGWEGIMVKTSGVTVTNKGTITSKGNAIAFDGSGVLDGTLVLASGSVTNGGVKVSGGKNKSTGFKLTIEEGAELNGRIVVQNMLNVTAKATGTLFSGIESSAEGAAIKFASLDNHSSSLTLEGTSFLNNTASAKTVIGGAVYTQSNTFTQNGGSYVGNKAMSSAYSSKTAGGASGGAVSITGGDVTFTDVVFTDNSAVAKADGKLGGFAYGGAVYADWNTTIGLDASVKFVVTKDAVYSGNTVSSDSTKKYNDMYGTVTLDNAAGGFLFLDRGVTSEFNVADGATLTIGSAVTTDDTDSIASSIRTQGTQYAASSITKTGTGTLVINSSLEKYYGTLAVNGGELQLNTDWTATEAVTVGEAGTFTGKNLTLGSLTTKLGDKVNNLPEDLSIQESKGTLNIAAGGAVTLDSLTVQDGSSATVAGSLTVGTISTTATGTLAVNGGTLTTSLAQLDTDATLGSTSLKLNDGLTITSGTVALTDEGTYTNASIDAMKKVFGNNTVITFLNATKSEADTTESLLEDNVVKAAESVKAEATVPAAGTATVDVKSSGAESVVVAGAKDTDPVAKNVTFTADGNSATSLTLVGSEAGGDLVTNAEGNAIDVTVGKNLTLNLGLENAKAETQGSLENVTLAEGADMTVVNMSADVAKFTTTDGSAVEVGSSAARGVLSVEELVLNAGSSIFIDPEWAASAEDQTIENASHFVVETVTTLDGSIVAGRNSLGTLHGTADEAVAAFHKLGLDFGEKAVTAALYVGAPVTLGSNALLCVDGSLTSDTATGTGVQVKNGGLLMVDQAGVGEKVFKAAATNGTTTVVFDQGSTLGILNATEGSFQLADTVTGADQVTVKTDNPFIEGAFVTADGKTTVQTTFDTDALGAVAAAGVQNMARRADFMFSETIADRTALDQDMHAGVNLWADVSAERYESSELDNNGSFRSDVAYAAFGGDVAVTDAFTVGAALQYGQGSVRTDNEFGLKNDLTSYGLSAYAAQKFGDAKIVGELSWIRSENDLSANVAALNATLDADVMSAGLRAQYELKAGPFKFIPSIGLRVSRIEADDLQVGAISFDHEDMTLVQVPVALRVTGYEAKADGWSFGPSFKLAWVPTFGDKGVNVAGYSQDVIDTNPVQGEFGIVAGKGNLLFNAGLSLGGGDNGASSVGGTIGVKYAF